MGMSDRAAASRGAWWLRVMAGADCWLGMARIAGRRQAEDAQTLMQPLPLSPTGQPVPGFPARRAGQPGHGPADLADDDIARLKAGRFKAGIAMQALDTPWNSLQVEAITRTLADYGIEVVAVTDAAQNPTRQAAQLAGLIERKVERDLLGADRPGDARRRPTSGSPPPASSWCSWTMSCTTWRRAATT